MQIKPTYFIEQVKSRDGNVMFLVGNPVRLLEWSLDISKSVGIETIAIFKIYPKTKPLIAHYDYDLKTTIVE